MRDRLKENKDKILESDKLFESQEVKAIAWDPSQSDLTPLDDDLEAS